MMKNYFFYIDVNVSVLDTFDHGCGVLLVFRDHLDVFHTVVKLCQVKGSTLKYRTKNMEEREVLTYIHTFNPLYQC